jgi:hypothetical protein
VRNIESHLRKIERELVEMQIRQALEMARAVPRDQFAATLLARLPLGPEPETILLDLDLLSPDELLLVAQMDPRWPDPALLTYDQLQRIAAGEPFERVMQPMPEV